MFDWLTHTARSVWHGVTSDVSSFVHGVLAGLVGLLTTLFAHVTGAWDDLERAAHDLEVGAKLYGESLWRKLSEIVGYWIPHFAYTAWWWVTHPSALAETLTWHIVAWLERNAWVAGRYLGEFTLALLARNPRRIARLAETIVTAVL